LRVGRIENLERRISRLSPKELSEFRKWFTAFDAQAWDRQFEADVRAGKLDELTERALKVSSRRTKV
jgi:hypothetical protein